MKGSSKVIMGATLAIVVILAIVLGLILVLLAELYCSILLRRRKFNDKNPGSAPENPTSPQQPQEHLVPSPLSSFYAQGVLEAPRSFLFPKLPSKREKHGKLHQFLRIQSPQLLGLASSSSSPPPLNKTPEIKVEIAEKDLMYISNPMYDNEVNFCQPIQTATPFETPDSSPSHLDRSGSSGSEEEGEKEKKVTLSPSSLPLSPMKELPDKAASVSLKDASCLGSCSESNSHVGRSSSSSDSPRTSPSW
ncbi:unnamed protein product [Amaranthus hypochondriacus]